MYPGEKSEEQEVMENDRIIDQNSGDIPPQSDTHLSMALITVKSGLTKEEFYIGVDAEGKPTKDKKKIVGYMKMQRPTKYKELLTEDLTTAFNDDEREAIVRMCQDCCIQIKSIGQASGYDLSPSHNRLADIHNAAVVSSKSKGQGAHIAKSQFVESKSQRTYEFDKKKKPGWRDMLGV